MKRKQRLKQAREAKLQELEEPSETSPKVILCVCVCSRCACVCACVSIAVHVHAAYIFVVAIQPSKKRKRSKPSPEGPENDQQKVHDIHIPLVLYKVSTE